MRFLSSARRFPTSRLLLAACALPLAPHALAAITTTGDVSPDPATTTASDVLHVGNTGQGSLTITNGDVISSFQGYIGREPGSQGDVRISGVNSGSGLGSGWTVQDDLRIGWEGQSQGRLTLSDGADVMLGNSLYLGHRPGAEGTFVADGVGTTLSVGNILVVGTEGQGLLSVTNGAHVTSVLSLIGWASENSGQVTVDGPGSRWSADEIWLGARPGNSPVSWGTLTIANGGLVEVAGAISSGVTSDQGYVQFNGGTLDAGEINVEAVNLRGTGTIYTHHYGAMNLIEPMVLDGDDPAPYLQKALTQQPGQNITINYDLNGLGKFVLNQGDLTLVNGREGMSGLGFIARDAGTTASLTIDGVGSTWTSRGALEIGSLGNGQLNIINGGTLQTDDRIRIGSGLGSEGYVRVDGEGFSWITKRDDLSVGEEGMGTLEITNGARVSSGRGFVGWRYSSRGVVRIDGPGSIWINSDLFIDGTLHVSNGAAVESSENRIGNTAEENSYVSIDGEGSSLTSSSQLLVGDTSDGQLDITNGARVTANRTWLGHGAGTVGTVRIDGAGSEWVGRGSIVVGDSGVGVLTVTNGASLITGSEPGSNSRRSIISLREGSVGHVIVDGAGSQWINYGGLRVGHAGVGTLTVANGAKVTIADDFTVNTAVGSQIIFDQGSLHLASLAQVNAVAPEGWAGVGSIFLAPIAAPELLVNSAVEDIATLSPTTLAGRIDSLAGQDITIYQFGATDFATVRIGQSAAGSLRIDDGTAVTGTTTYVGDTAMGGLVIDGSGASWSGDVLFIGYEQAGSMTVSGGALVYTAAEATLGERAGSLGQATVQGAGSMWSLDGWLKLGRLGEGSLSVLDGGQVDVQGSTLFSTGARRQGLGDHGSLTVSGAGSVFKTHGDLLTVNLGTSEIVIDQGGQIVVDGNMNGSSRLTLSLGLTDGGDPLMDVLGSVTLAGLLEIDWSPEFAMADGQSLILIDVGTTRSGMFSNYAEGDLLGTFNGGELFLTYTGGDGNDVAAYATAVPEPGAGLMMFAGLMGLARRRRGGQVR